MPLWTLPSAHLKSTAPIHPTTPPGHNNQLEMRNNATLTGQEEGEIILGLGDPLGLGSCWLVFSGTGTEMGEA